MNLSWSLCCGKPKETRFFQCEPDRDSHRDSDAGDSNHRCVLKPSRTKIGDPATQEEVACSYQPIFVLVIFKAKASLPIDFPRSFA